jgi:hypothetical protein
VLHQSLQHQSFLVDIKAILKENNLRCFTPIINRALSLCNNDKKPKELFQFPIDEKVITYIKNNLPMPHLHLSRNDSIYRAIETVTNNTSNKEHDHFMGYLTCLTSPVLSYSDLDSIKQLINQARSDQTNGALTKQLQFIEEIYTNKTQSLLNNLPEALTGIAKEYNWPYEDVLDYYDCVSPEKVESDINFINTMEALMSYLSGDSTLLSEDNKENITIAPLQALYTKWLNGRRDLLAYEILNFVNQNDAIKIIMQLKHGKQCD